MFGPSPAWVTSAEAPDCDPEQVTTFSTTEASTASAKAQDCDLEPAASSTTTKTSPASAEAQEHDSAATSSSTIGTHHTSTEALDITTEFDPAEAAIVNSPATSTTEADDTSDDGYASDAISNASYSIYSSIREYKYEYGRRFHKFKDGRYYLPNDKREQDRENLKHALVLALCGCRLHFAPIGDNPQNIIDIGTGTGAWCMAMGEQYPSAQVLGIDLSPIQPTWVPPNVKFMIDDAESEWLDKENFYDFIHLRHMTYGIKNFPALLRRALRHLKPGGWIEFQEMHLYPHCDDGSMPSSWPFLKWYDLALEGAFSLGFNIDFAREQIANLQAYGFTNVQHKAMRVPIGTWPKNNAAKAIGHNMRLSYLDGLEGLSIGPLCRGLGWNKEAVDVYLVDVRKSILNPYVHAYHPFHIYYGQKPEE